MISLLKPKCPVDIREKVWTEQRMLWLAHRFGIERMKRAVIVLPTAEFFPDPYHGDADGARAVFERVCQFMDVRPDRFELAFGSRCTDGECRRAASGDVPTIEITNADIVDQQRLIATLAHSIARDILIQTGHADDASEDLESLSELLATFLGFGVFLANTVIKVSKERMGDWESWSIRRAGHLQARVIGYAKSLMAWVREETRPVWSGMLGADARHAFKGGYRYISKTNDCLFRADTAGKPAETRSTTSIVDDLRNGTETRQLASVWTILEEPAAQNRESVAALSHGLRHRNPVIVTETARVICGLKEPADPLLPMLIENLSAEQSDVRAWSALAVGLIRPPLDARPDGLEVREALAALLDDTSPGVVDAALKAFAEYGREAEPMLAGLIPRLVLFARDCRFEFLNYGVQQVARIVEDPKRFLSEHLEDTDAELRDRILAELRMIQTTAADGSETAVD